MSKLTFFSPGSGVVPNSLVLAKRGCFFVGGRTEFRDPNAAEPTATRWPPGVIAIDHTYVEYQIPRELKSRYPILFVPGGSHTGVMYDTTPDGREGWYNSFTRRGFPCFQTDMPNRGRSGFESTQILVVRQGRADAASLPVINRHSVESAWVGFRFGPKPGVPFDDCQFPLDYMDQYVRQMVPFFGGLGDDAKLVAGLVAVFERIGPSIVVAHSQGGRATLRAAVSRPDLIKAVVVLEPSAPEPAEGLERFPIMWLVGDNYTADFSEKFGDPGVFASSINARGGRVQVIELPKLGILGNGHMMMMDRNSEELADLTERWIREAVDCS